jgi:sporulation protein YlmC with PRC-barrel domain
MSVDPWQVQVDAYVVGSDGEAVGQVKEVGQDNFLVNRSMDRDVYVPFGAIQAITDYSIMLTIPAGRVDDIGWPKPPLSDSVPII